MLVLSRKAGETIVIGDSIEVVVLEVHGNRISVGIKAPPPMRISRSELPLETRTRRPQAVPAAAGWK